jgi:anion-transporting  ArsA/GET3 family ATPase
LVCCGSGGVGKTTVSATLGVRGALLGKRVLTLTIDPAKRLANALGLSHLGNTETMIPRDEFLRCGVEPMGSLYAMMLDTKHTFDELIKRYAPNEQVTKNILSNYQNLSSAMAGSHEYLAMEKLYQIYLGGRYDLIVLDTPPTKHALDFLEAPSRVRAFFDRSISQWFLRPYLTMGRVGLNLFNRTAGTVLRLVERFTGAEFLHDVAEFISGLADAFDIFRSRAEEVMHVLRGEATSFLLITGAERTAFDEAIYFSPYMEEVLRRVQIKTITTRTTRRRPFGPIWKRKGDFHPPWLSVLLRISTATSSLPGGTASSFRVLSSNFPDRSPSRPFPFSMKISLT